MSIELNTESEVEDDNIKYVDSFKIDKALEIIPWLGGTDEFKEFAKNTHARLT